LPCSHLLDEFCDSYPHNCHPTPGYWIECSRAINDRGSAWTNEDGGGEDDLAEIDEGITNSPDGSLRDASGIAEYDDQDSRDQTVPR
jgi:hypothetical protein